MHFFGVWDFPSTLFLKHVLCPMKLMQKLFSRRLSMVQLRKQRSCSKWVCGWGVRVCHTHKRWRLRKYLGSSEEGSEEELKETILSWNNFSFCWIFGSLLTLILITLTSKLCYNWNQSLAIKTLKASGIGLSTNWIRKKKL